MAVMGGGVVAAAESPDGGGRIVLELPGFKPAGPRSSPAPLYAGVIEAHREAIAATEDLDPVTQDMLIGEAGQLEQFHCFVRAHLEGPDGSLATGGARTEHEAAGRAGQS